MGVNRVFVTSNGDSYSRTYGITPSYGIPSGNIYGSGFEKIFILKIFAIIQVFSFKRFHNTYNCNAGFFNNFTF